MGKKGKKMMPIDVNGKKTANDTGDFRIFHCSECGYGVDDIYEKDVFVYEAGKEWNFCPNCGAKINNDATESKPQFYYNYGAVKVVQSKDGRPYPVLLYHDVGERKEDAEIH